MSLKTCSRCRTEKPFALFTKRAASPDGLHPYCRECTQAYNKAKYAINPDLWKAAAVRWAKANPEKRAEASRAAARRYYRANTAKCHAANKKWAASNKERIAAYDATKKAKRRVAIARPRTELDDLAFVEAADLCRLRAAALGGEWHVDHVVPLRCKTACGLHNAFNLAVVPGTYNASKKNRLVEQPGFVVERRP